MAKDEMIPFNKPVSIVESVDSIKKAILNNKISGDGEFTKKCNAWIEGKTNSAKVLLTTSCTHALEMAALLTGVKPGDEVIMPSFTFVSTADAFVQRGATIVFVDIRPDTMNIDENKIEEAITKKTKVIVPVHYAGVSCEMDKILDLAQKYNLFVVEDAAQGVMSEYKGTPLGAIGDFGCYSFHETKNYTMGEGGAILIKNQSDIERAEIIREKGTNRAKFFRGQIDKYTWVDYGSSYLPSELNAAYLFPQLLKADEINDARLHIWNLYKNGLEALETKRCIKLPFVPKECKHNAHMFYIKVENLEVRSKLIDHLKENGILTVFHYVPLHTAPAGIKYGRFSGVDKFTTSESEKLLRLPLFFGLLEEQVEYIIEKIKSFFD